MLQLRHVFLSGRLFGKIPGQHEFRLEDCAVYLNAPVGHGGEPADGRMADLLLHIGDNLPGTGLVPAPVQLLGDEPKLDEEVARQILGLDLATFLSPQPQKRGFVLAHDDPGIRTADEVAAIRRFARPLIAPSPPKHPRPVAPCRTLRMSGQKAAPQFGADRARSGRSLRRLR